MVRKVWLLALLLAGCGSNNPPPPPPLPVAFSGPVAPSKFIVTQSSGNGGSSIGVPVPQNDGSGGFALPQCKNASTCWTSYIEAPLGLVSLTGRPSITMSYTISGVAPVFDCETPNNNANCGLPGQGGGWPSTVRLLLQRYGDQMTSPTFDGYRWFSGPFFLALGTNSMTMPLSLDGFSPVENTAANQAQLPAALAQIEAVGFCFGGGSFACHGVAIPSGSATFKVNSYTVN